MLILTEVALRYLKASLVSENTESKEKERLELISAYKQVLKFSLNGELLGNKILS